MGNPISLSASRAALVRLLELSSAIARSRPRRSDGGALKSFDNRTELKEAADDWCADGANRSAAEITYGKIEAWNISQVNDLSFVFDSYTTCLLAPPCTSTRRVCNPRVGSWDVSHVTNMRSMFGHLKGFDQDLSQWNVARRVTTMESMFRETDKFNPNISGWDMGQVESIEYMFWYAEAFDQALCWNMTSMMGTRGWNSGSGAVFGEINQETGSCERTFWQKYGTVLLGLATAAVLVYMLVTVLIEDVDDEEEVPPTLWEETKTMIADTFGLNRQQLSWQADGRRSSGSSVMQIHIASPTEAYTAIQVLSTTSSSALTHMLVQQLQASNYTGPMPTMVTAVIQQVTEAGGGSSGSESMTLVIAASVAGGLLLLAGLVVGALVYLWRTSKKTNAAQPGSLDVVPTEIIRNPMHTEDEQARD